MSITAERGTRAAAPGTPSGAGPTRSALALDVSHLTKRYGHRTVVDDLSFTAQPGRVTGFLGPNGSGKSTTMKMLLGLASPNGGRALIGGVTYRELPEPARTVGVVLEPNAFHPDRSGRNHLRVLADATGIAAARVDETLTAVGLDAEAADRRVATYSLGMKQRLSLAAALLGDPPVLVLDEPANGLDPRGIHALRDLLRARAHRGHTVFVSSHLLGEIEHLADDVVVIDRGRLVTCGVVEELRRAASFVRTSSPDVLVKELELAGATVERPEPGALVVTGISMDEIGVRAFAAGAVLHELSAHAGSLEELFLAWTVDGEAVDEEVLPS
ncbi:MAG: ATP-binding cassette domain-containing protein [Actinomycetota bacterium]|nr:ATP-binding cassette domain-containing protein [Actinomycetota bacterium]